MKPSWQSFLWGAWAILMFAGAAGALVWRLNRPGSALRQGAKDAPPVAEAAPAPPPPPSALPPGEPIAAAQDRTVGRRGRSTGELFAGFDALGASVSRCAALSTPAAPGSPRSAVLVLDLEPLAGKVKIVGASPYPGSAASDALVACARSEMVGREVAVAGARPGRVYKMSYSIRY